MIIYAADDPLVLDGTYDREGYKPGERARIAKARAQQAKGLDLMAKREKKTAAASGKGRPQKQALPGMEDRAIRPLEQAAAAYADIRDQRIALNVDEAKLKASLLTLMHKHGKTVYSRDGITITVIPEGESVKVKVRKPGEAEDDEPGEDLAGEELRPGVRAEH